MKEGENSWIPLVLIIIFLVGTGFAFDRGKRLLFPDKPVHYDVSYMNFSD